MSKTTPEGFLTVVEAADPIGVVKNTADFVKEQNRENAMKLNQSIGGAYGAGAGFLVAGPFGAAVGASLGAIGAGFLTEATWFVQGLFS